MPFDLSTLESRFWHVLDDVKSDAEAALHSKIVDAVVAAGKAILPLVPDGTEVESILTKLDEFVVEAHNAISAVAPVAQEAADSAPSAPAAGEVAPTDPPAAPADAEAVRTNEAGTPLPPV